MMQPLGKVMMIKLKQLWDNTDSIEIVLFAALAFCMGWGIYHTIIAAIERFT